MIQIHTEYVAARKGGEQDCSLCLMASWIREVYQNKFSRIKLTTVTQWPYLTVSDGCQYQGTGYVKY